MACNIPVLCAIFTGLQDVITANQKLCPFKPVVAAVGGPAMQWLGFEVQLLGYEYTPPTELI